MSNHSGVKYLIILNNNYHSFNIVISQLPDVNHQHQGKSLNTLKPRQGKSEMIVKAGDSFAYND